MRRIVIPALTLLIGCAAGVAVREVVVPARAQGQAGPSYEYDVVVVQEYWSETAKRKDVLAKYGREGWHLTNAVHLGSNAATLYFERPLAR